MLLNEFGELNNISGSLCELQKRISTGAPFALGFPLSLTRPTSLKTLRLTDLIPVPLISEATFLLTNKTLIYKVKDILLA